MTDDDFPIDDSSLDGDLPLDANDLGIDFDEFADELAAAKGEPIAAPEAFDGTETVAGVRVAKMRLGAPDASGRRAPENDPGSEYRVEADLVIKALGFDAEDLPKMFGSADLGVTRWGTLRVDHKTMQTSLDGVFAAGDIVRGASLVVWAIRDGRDVSDHMHRYLKQKAVATMAGRMGKAA